jgi:hypothetical protein
MKLLIVGMFLFIIRPHIVFTDRRQRQQPNHNTTTYCVYWRKTLNQTWQEWFSIIWFVMNLNSNMILIGWHVKTNFKITWHEIGNCRNVSLHHVSYDRNMWSCYDWVVYHHILCLLTDDNNNKPNHNTTTYCVYWQTTTTTTQS